MVKVNPFEAMMKQSRGASGVGSTEKNSSIGNKSKKIEKEQKSKKSSNTKMRISSQKSNKSCSQNASQCVIIDEKDQANQKKVSKESKKTNNKMGGNQNKKDQSMKVIELDGSEVQNEIEDSPIVGMFENPMDINTRIISFLERMMKKYELERNKGKVFGYRRAINGLKAYRDPITNPKVLDNIPGVGPKTVEKIKEFLESGEFQKIENPFTEKMMNELEELQKIWGVGQVKAMDIHKAGFTSVAKLRDRQSAGREIPLTSLQLIGLKYYEDLLEKIPRAEVQDITEVVQRAVFNVFPKQKMQIQTVGSYRRGREMCGDVDILITLDDEDKYASPKKLQPKSAKLEVQEIQGILPKLVNHLTATGFLIERLGADRIAKTGSQTYMGICKLKKRGSLARHIDIKVYPKSQYGFAVMYFTGSAAHNIKMRNEAITYGFSLSDAGLSWQSDNTQTFLDNKKASKQPVSSGDPRIQESMTKLASTNIVGQVVTEGQIFLAFGMDFVEPCDRI